MSMKRVVGLVRVIMEGFYEVALKFSTHKLKSQTLPEVRPNLLLIELGQRNMVRNRVKCLRAENKLL